jgi:uncharacterized protein YycO
MTTPTPKYAIGTVTTGTYINIRFITEADLISDAIRVETWSPFSHVEFILDDGTYLGAHASGGVAIRPAYYCKPTREERYAIPCTQEQKDAILAYAHSQIGKPYDFTDIVGILIHRDWHAEDSWICSELVAAAFEKGGLPLLHTPMGIVSRITPEQDYLSSLLINRMTYQFPAQKAA